METIKRDIREILYKNSKQGLNQSVVREEDYDKVIEAICETVIEPLMPIIDETTPKQRGVKVLIVGSVAGSEALEFLSNKNGLHADIVVVDDHRVCRPEKMELMTPRDISLVIDSMREVYMPVTERRKGHERPYKYHR